MFQLLKICIEMKGQTYEKILRHTWKTVRYNLGSLLIFETGYRILSFFWL